MDKIQYKGYTAGLGPSPAIWADCPVLEMILDPAIGYHFFDDFLNFSDHISGQNVQQYASYIDVGVTIKSLATAVGGVIQIAGNDADNDEGSITTGGNAGVVGVISDTAAAARKLWFEARIRSVTTVANEGIGFFLGLAGEGLAAADTLDDDTTDVVATKSFIGFNNLVADGDSLDFLYQAVADSAPQRPTGLQECQLMVADTWYKLGFVYDPDAPADSRIKVFVDGTEQATKITATNIAAATFPDAEEMALLLATKVGTASECKFDMDWWRFAQLR